MQAQEKEFQLIRLNKQIHVHACGSRYTACCVVLSESIYCLEDSPLLQPQTRRGRREDDRVSERERDGERC